MKTHRQTAAAIAEPLVGLSARFPTARPAGSPASTDSPSPPDVRPWGLAPAALDRTVSGATRSTGWRYDPVRQVSVDGRGRPVTLRQPTAVKNTSNDGDEGPSEDFSYDFCPDEPGGV